MLMTWSWQLLLSLITIATAVIAAGFGILGLTTKYKEEDGRLTRYGRIAVCGVVVSAFFAISSQAIKDRMAYEQSEKAKEDAEAARKNAVAEQARQQKEYKDQIDELVKANKSLLALQGDMTTALETGTTNIQRSESILQSTIALREQQRRSSHRMLRSIWDSANRVSGGEVVLMLGLNCKPGTNVWSLRNLFNGALASVRVADGRLASAAGDVATGLVFHALPQDFELVASHNETTVHKKQDSGGGRVEQTIQFGPFFGYGELGNYALIERWGGAAAQFRVEKRDLSMEELRDAFGALGTEEPVASSNDGFLYPIPCTVQFHLSVNGLMLAAPIGTLVYRKAAPGDRYGSLIALSYLALTKTALIPRFVTR